MFRSLFCFSFVVLSVVLFLLDCFVLFVYSLLFVSVFNLLCFCFTLFEFFFLFYMIENCTGHRIYKESIHPVLLSGISLLFFCLSKVY